MMNDKDKTIKINDLYSSILVFVFCSIIVYITQNETRTWFNYGTSFRIDCVGYLRRDAVYECGPPGRGRPQFGDICYITVLYDCIWTQYAN